VFIRPTGAKLAGNIFSKDNVLVSATEIYCDAIVNVVGTSIGRVPSTANSKNALLGRQDFDNFRDISGAFGLY
jgi:hypothetical protein